MQRKDSKKGKRNFNEHDLEKFFKKISNTVTKLGAAYKLENYIIYLDKIIEKCDHLINQPWYDYEDFIMFDAAKSELSAVDNRVALKKHIDEIVNEIKSYGNDERINNIKKSLNDIDNKLSEIDADHVDADKLELDKFLLDNILKEMSSNNCTEETLKETIKESEKKLLGNHDKRSRALNKDTMSLKPIITYEDINEISKISDRKQRFEYLKKKKLPTIKRWKARYKSLKKKYEELGQKLKGFEDMSTATRYNISKDYIKEYFEELFDDYYFYD